MDRITKEGFKGELASYRGEETTGEDRFSD